MASLAENHVTELIKAGADAMSNMYDVKIVFPDDIQTQLGTDIQAMIVRAKGFTPPEAEVVNYKVNYKTVEIDRPATKITMNRQFTISFRLDAYYAVYRALKMWAGRNGTPSTGYASNALWDSAAGSPNNIKGRVIVTALSTPVLMDPSNPYFAEGVNTGNFSENPNSENLIWEFDDVWVQKMTEPQFTMDDAGTMDIEATFFFGNMKDPHYNQWLDIGAQTPIDPNNRG